jgi:two-component sensor histidine kinase
MPRSIRLHVTASLCRGLILVGILWTEPIPAQPASRPAVEPPRRLDRRILTIDVGDPNRPAFVRFNEAFLRRLRADTGLRTTVYREHQVPLEGNRIPSWDAATIEYWGRRYASIPLDLIIAGGEAEFWLATALRSRLGRQIPILYRASAATSPTELARLAETPMSTGLLEPPAIRPVVEDLVRLRPALRELLIILQNPRELPGIRSEVELARPGLRVTPWFAPPLDALRDSVRRLPSDAAVLYISIFRDGEGRLWTPADFLEAFADTSAQPVLGLYQNLVGRGILGGPVIDPIESGERMAEGSLAVLRDPRIADGRQMPMTQGWRPSYAWSALRRHAIDLGRLPPGAEIVGRPVPPWVAHPVAFWAVTLLLLFQTISILALVANRQMLQRAKNELSALTRRLQRTQEREQARLARELHDTLAQDLLSQSLDLQRYAPAASAPQQPPFADRLRQAVTRLEAITHELHPSALQMLDLRAAVHQLVTDLRSRTTIEVSISERGLDRPIPEEIRAAVFRIIQEALTNIRRHAQATQAIVLLDAGDSSLTVTIRDDGIGFDPARRTQARLGLLGMRERAAAIDGQLDVESAPDNGTSVILTVTLPSPR